VLQMGCLVMQAPEIEFFFRVDNDSRSQPQPESGDPFFRCKKLYKAAIIYAKVANGANFFTKGPSSQPRGVQLELDFFGREHEGAAEGIAAEGLHHPLLHKC
jgi:hypothetical protein